MAIVPVSDHLRLARRRVRKARGIAGGISSGLFPDFSASTTIERDQEPCFQIVGKDDQ